MKIVLTGAGGQLGQQWQQWAASQTDVTLWAYSSAQLDITNPDTFDEVLGRHDVPDVWVNCAAYTQVDHAAMQKLKQRVPCL
jgi:dTDP-4-dehydrorhamnose reductase